MNTSKNTIEYFIVLPKHEKYELGIFVEFFLGLWESLTERNQKS